MSPDEAAPGPGGEDAGGPRGPSPWRFVGLGFELAVPVIVGLYAGYRLDAWLETAPWLAVAGAALGMFLGFYAFLKTVLAGPRDGGSGRG